MNEEFMKDITQAFEPGITSFAIDITRAIVYLIERVQADRKGTFLSELELELELEAIQFMIDMKIRTSDIAAKKQPKAFIMKKQSKGFINKKGYKINYKKNNLKILLRKNNKKKQPDTGKKVYLEDIDQEFMQEPELITTDIIRAIKGLIEGVQADRRGTFLSELELELEFELKPEAIQFMIGMKIRTSDIAAKKQPKAFITKSLNPIIFLIDNKLCTIVYKKSNLKLLLIKNNKKKQPDTGKKGHPEDIDQESMQEPVQADGCEPVVSWLPEIEPKDETLVCIDFGTSLSKAYASEGDDPEEAPRLIDIALSPEADGSARYLLPSELLIHQGKINFGRTARKVFDKIAAEQDRLIDNPKQYMTLSRNVSNLEKRKLPKEKDPDNRFSERDALVLYLSHLVRMVDQSLEASEMPKSISMRYTHPAWKENIAEQNTGAMRRIVAEAVALARNYPCNFETRMDVDRASKLLSAARKAADKNLPLRLLKDPVAEATAAGVGAFMEAPPTGRQYFVILDIGAGTTDVAGCICVNGRGQRARVWEITSARSAKKVAGNEIDNILRKFILERSNLANDSPEYFQARRALRKTVRAEKETLFSEGEVLVEVGNDELVHVSLDDFRVDRRVDKIFRVIKRMVTRAAFAVREGGVANIYAQNIYLVPTGGGANLSPLIQELVSEPLARGDQRVRLELRNAMPSQIQEAYPEIEPYYPQLAVAIGGAHPALPEQKPALKRFDGDLGPTYLQSTYTTPHS